MIYEPNQMCVFFSRIIHFDHYVIKAYDLTNFVKNCNIRRFTDDTCRFTEVVDCIEAANKVNENLSHNKWSKRWIVQFSSSKTTSLMIINKRDL